LGVVEGDTVRDVTAALDVLPSYRHPLPCYDVVVANLETLRPHIDGLSRRAQPLPLADLKLLSPVANPGKLIAAPVNYRRHLEEARGNAELHHGNQVAVIERAGLFLK